MYPWGGEGPREGGSGLGEADDEGQGEGAVLARSKKEETGVRVGGPKVGEFLLRTGDQRAPEGSNFESRISWLCR